MIILSAFLIKNQPRFINVVNFINTPVDSIPMSAEENTAVRYLVVLQSMEIIKQNLFFGAGTGDVKDELMEKYKEKNIIHAIGPPVLNAHNQFLETLIGLGIPGIFSLFILIFYSIYNGIWKRQILLFAFMLIIIFNFMSESMLNTQAGVLFFAFFNTLLLNFPSAGTGSGNQPVEQKFP